IVKRGVLRLSIVGLDDDEKTVSRIGGVKIHVVDVSNQPPPAIPGRDPPMRCFSPTECPPEFLGSPACPGTKATSSRPSWGMTCEKNNECAKGLVCSMGSCERPPKCDTDAECSSGECHNGACVVLDAEEAASSLGPGKANWIGLHFGVDMALMHKAVGVC